MSGDSCHILKAIYFNVIISLAVSFLQKDDTHILLSSNVLYHLALGTNNAFTVKLQNSRSSKFLKDPRLLFAFLLQVASKCMVRDWYGRDLHGKSLLKSYYHYPGPPRGGCSSRPCVN